MRRFLLLGLVLLLGCAKTKKPQTQEATDSATQGKPLENSTPKRSPQPDVKSNSKQTENKNTIDLGVRPPKAKPQYKRLEPAVFDLPGAGQMVDIPAGEFLRGSAVDDELRDQFAENDHIPTKMTSFQMDALPWPNDPAMPAMTGVNRYQAEQYCKSVGKRLCTELEYEWACKSSDNRRYISGNYYHPTAYAAPHGTASLFGVFAMGTVLEWTSSAWGTDPDQIERVAVRGFAKEQEFLGKVISAKQGTRCAKRWRYSPEQINEHLGFRCCTGQVNTPACFIERPRPAHSRYKTMKPEEFKRIIRSIPELEAVHDNPHMFSNGDVRAVLAKRGSNRKELAKSGIHFLWKPLRWIPRQGMELWLAVGRSNRHSFIVALHEVKDNKEYVHESSMIIWDNPIPLALVYREGHRDEVYWAPCWRCRDGGGFEYDEDKNQVIITSRW